MVSRKTGFRKRFVFLPVAQSDTGCESSQWEATELNSSCRLPPQLCWAPLEVVMATDLLRRRWRWGSREGVNFTVAFAFPTTHLMTVKRKLFTGISSEKSFQSTYTRRANA